MELKYRWVGKDPHGKGKGKDAKTVMGTKGRDRLYGEKEGELLGGGGVCILKDEKI